MELDTSSLRASLTQMVEATERMGHPSLIERFILRNATCEAEGSPYEAKPMREKECFMNAAKLMERGDYRYVEGFAIRRSLGIPIHHAWAVDLAGRVLDPTWRRPEECFYLGVVFEPAEVWQRQLETGYYGLLAGAHGMIAADFIFERDPELKAICESVMGRSERVY